MPFRQSIMKRAVLTTALFIFSASGNSSAKPNAAYAAIEKAQSLLLHRKRQEALTALADIKNSPLTPGEKKELAEFAQEAATRFLTDKGQRSFELGQSQIPFQAANALKHLKEAQALEDGNYQIEVALARVNLIQEECTAAKTILEPLFPELAMGAEIQELLLQVAWCLEDQTLAEAVTRKKSNEVKLSPALVKANQGWMKWKLKEPEKALNFLKEAVAAEPRNPAVLYWLWRIQKDQDLSGEPAAQAFANRCRAREADIRRRTFTMVEFCLRLAEVEAYLKGKGAETQDANP